MLSIKELLKKIGLWTVFILITAILTISFGFILNYFKLNENVAIGIPGILVFYFWGGYFLRKQDWSKVLGIVLFLTAIILNFVFISSPYDTASEFKATRVFLLFPLLASIFLILRKGKISRLMGALVIILTILCALLGAVFCSDCRTPQTLDIVDTNSEAPNPTAPSTATPAYIISISDPNTKTTERYKCSNYHKNQADTLMPSDSLRQKLNDDSARLNSESAQLNSEFAQLNEMSEQSSTNNYSALLDTYNARLATYNAQSATYEADRKQYDSEMQACRSYIKAHCAYVGN